MGRGRVEMKCGKKGEYGANRRIGIVGLGEGRLYVRNVARKRK